MDIGNKLKRLRIRNGLTQEELADRCELSKGFISQVERDLASPSIATLEDMLQSLGTDLKTFFNDAEDKEVVFTAKDTFVKQNTDNGNTINWIVPNAQKRDMEPIIIDLEPGGKSYEDYPHDGEEFGYVLSGSIVIELGEKRIRARKDESFYFKPTQPHRIVNASKQPAKLIWVATPPSF